MTIRAAAFVAALAAVLLVPPFTLLARGTYEYARAEGKRCITCHDTTRPNATNLNDTGRFYLVNRRLPAEGELTAPAPAPAGETGEAIYARACAACHGPDGKGTALAPSLLGALKHGESEEAIRKVVREGVPGTAMVAFTGVLSDEQIDLTIAHMRALRKGSRH